MEASGTPHTTSCIEVANPSFSRDIEMGRCVCVGEEMDGREPNRVFIFQDCTSFPDVYLPLSTISKSLIPIQFSDSSRPAAPPATPNLYKAHTQRLCPRQTYPSQYPYAHESNQHNYLYIHKFNQPLTLRLPFTDPAQKIAVVVIIIHNESMLLV